MSVLQRDIPKKLPLLGARPGGMGEAIKMGWLGSPLRLGVICLGGDHEVYSVNHNY